ncbi:MAG TPA: hypothetical protein VN493_00505 [Thermoanaerobaculia bacterium]|nr:hypothetical protein [Thermoanaerobaculia bacterium]
MWPPRSLLASFALALFALYLAASLSWAALNTARTGVLMVRVRGETPFQERSRSYSPEYAEGIATIRRTIPREGAYLLINGTPEERGGPFWVKYDLAPRRAIFLGDLDKLDNIDRLRKRMPRAARWVVIAHGPYGRPELIERYRFVQGMKGRGGA